MDNLQQILGTDKHNPAFAVGAVGIAGGRSQLGKLITFREFHTYVSDYLFFRTGIPTKRGVADVVPRLDRACDKFHRAIVSREQLSWRSRAMERLDIFIMRKFMLEKNPDHVYDNVVARWEQEGLM